MKVVEREMIDMQSVARTRRDNLYADRVYLLRLTLDGGEIVYSVEAHEGMQLYGGPDEATAREVVARYIRHAEGMHPTEGE